MFKANPRLSSALLALALSMLASQAARAQGTTQDKGEQDKAAARQTRQPTQSGGAKQQQSANTPAPLTAGEKVKGSLRGAFLSPLPYAMSAFAAGLTQLNEDRQPQKDNADEAADWGSRTARNFATRTTSSVFTKGVYPALFKQDPRYEPSRSRKFGPRVAHALGRVFVTRDDDGNLEPNYSRFAGAMTASALANVWERSTPGHDRIGADATLRRFGRSFISASISNVFMREFGPDIIAIFRH
jgi:hypothetical protein